MYRQLTNLLVILLISTTTFAARNNNTITGKVIEKENGKALSYATISVHDKDSKVVGGAISNEEGKFSVEKLMNDSYKVKSLLLDSRIQHFSLKRRILRR